MISFAVILAGKTFVSQFDNVLPRCHFTLQVLCLNLMHYSNFADWSLGIFCRMLQF